MPPQDSQIEQPYLDPTLASVEPGVGYTQDLPWLATSAIQCLTYIKPSLVLMLVACVLDTGVGLVQASAGLMPGRLPGYIQGPAGVGCAMWVYPFSEI